MEQGLTVFVVSWINPDETQGAQELLRLHAGRLFRRPPGGRGRDGRREGEHIGYCVGGTLVAASLGYMAAKQDHRVNAATFFTTQVDFEKAGDLLVYVDDEQVKWIEERMSEKGYLPGERMADAFNLLRSNDLIWSYVVNNYMLGKRPDAVRSSLLECRFDAHAGGRPQSLYLRECYLHNRLSQGKMVLGQRARSI